MVNNNLLGMFGAAIAFGLPSRTYRRRLAPTIGVQHGLSFNDPFKQHSSSSRICCLRQLSRLWRIFDLFSTTADETRCVNRCSIELAEEPITSTAGFELETVLAFCFGRTDQQQNDGLFPPLPRNPAPLALRE